MNPSQAANVVQNIEIIRAFSEGKPVQIKSPSGVWQDVYSPSFTGELEYRVKPEKAYLLFSDDGKLYSAQPFPSTASAAAWAKKYARHQCLRMVEVSPEDGIPVIHLTDKDPTHV